MAANDKYLVGNPAEIKKQVDAAVLGQWDNVYIVEVLESRVGESILLVKISEPTMDW